MNVKKKLSMSIQRQNQKYKIKYFCYSLLILISHFKGIFFLVTERENKGRITPWVGKSADDAEKLRKLSAFFKED